MIEILPRAAHPNVPTIHVGSSLMLSGWLRGRIPIEAQRKSANVAVSASLLSCTLTVDSMRNRHGWENGERNGARLHVVLEGARNGRHVALHQFPPIDGPGDYRAVVDCAGCESVRASYYFARTAAIETTITDEVAITWSLIAKEI